MRCVTSGDTESKKRKKGCSCSCTALYFKKRAAVEGRREVSATAEVSSVAAIRGEKNVYFIQKVSFVFVEERQELRALRVEADRAAGGDDIG